jgi:hypothetical protein
MSRRMIGQFLSRQTSLTLHADDYGVRDQDIRIQGEPQLPGLNTG